MSSEDWEELERLVKEIARKSGYKYDKSINLIAELTIAFLRSIIDGKRKYRVIMERLGDKAEWMTVAFTAKKIPACKHPCAFSGNLETVLSLYGFGNMNYMTLLKMMRKVPDEI